MNKVKLVYGDKSVIIAAPDSIVKLFNDIEERAGKQLDEFKARLLADPNKSLFEDLSVFDSIDITEDDETDFEIVNSYFMQQGKAKFNFDETDIICEQILPSDEDKQENIFLVCDFFE